MIIDIDCVYLHISTVLMMGEKGITSETCREKETC